MHGPATFTTAAATTGVKVRIVRDSGPIAYFYVDEVTIGAIETGSFNNGRIQQITANLDSSKTISYTYDELNRLKTAATTGVHWGLSWTYDRWGNRQSQTVTKGAAAEAEKVLERSLLKMGFSARAYSRILKVARTIADLDARDQIAVGDISEAVQYRSLDRNV